jgi:hypothetical protein
MCFVSRHTAYLDAWVFTAIGGTKPEHGERLSLPEVIEGADYFNRAVISKEELEHGIRDLLNAGLITVSSDSFALTATGREMWETVWRNYEARQGGSHPIAIAEKRLKRIQCAAQLASWSVTQEEFDQASSAYRAHLLETFRKLDPKAAARMEQSEE